MPQQPKCATVCANRCRSAVARELGFIPVEVNASDTRNKADKSAKGGMAGKLANNIKELANNRALTSGAQGEEKKVLYILTDRCLGA